MAKGKKGEVSNKALYSRVSFLQQAATYLTAAQDASPISSKCTNPADSGSGPGPEIDSHGKRHPGSLRGIARRLATDMRSVSLKSRIRITPTVKQTVCKFCDSILVDGDTCSTVVENKSKNGKKPWADTLVRKCHTCGRERRYPIQSPRQKRRPNRSPPAAAGNLDSKPQPQHHNS